MVRHIVFLKLSDHSEKNKEFVKDKIMSMKGKIDYLRHLEVGVNFSPEDRAYDLALICEFDNKEDLKRYATDPIHVEVLQFLKSINTQTKVVDYQF
jgi:GR25 family glycosyltransferase involved in LPS biosynthesis